MPQTSPPLVFPIWREHWTPLDGIPALLMQVDATLKRRSAGNHLMPIGEFLPDHAKPVAMAIRAMRGWAEGELPNKATMNPAILVRRIHTIAEPLLHVVGWPRWLFLERALLDGSATGDLLFVALVLRT